MSKFVQDSYGHSGPAITAGTTQNVTTGAVSAQSAALGDGTRIVRLLATAACYVKFGSNPTAAAGDVLIPANVPEYFGVTGGEKIAAIQVSGAGILNITEAAS